MRKSNIENMLIERGQFDIEIRVLKNKIEVLKLDIQGIAGGTSYDDLKCTTNQVSSRVENEVLKRDEKINEYLRSIDRLEQKKRVVDEALMVLDDVENIIIKTRYVDRLSWYDTADKTGYSYTWCMKIKGRAFKKLSKVL